MLHILSMITYETRSTLLVSPPFFIKNMQYMHKDFY